MKVEVDFNDDKPVMRAADWQRFGEPARSWRHQEPPMLTAGELSKAAAIAIGLAVLVFAALVVVNCW